MAKLSRPQWYAALPRERLFAELDTLQAHRKAVFVIGPPGAGKSALVSTWVERRALSCLWFQVDAGDADLPTFFYLLREAASAELPHGATLPLLGPEYQADVPGFARRFFRALFAALPSGTVVVLDNLQDVPAEHSLHALLADAVEALPSAVTLLFVSRHDPPPAFARAIASEQVGFLGTRSLQLTEGEAAQIAAARGWKDPVLAGRLLARCGGWAAGLTLMLERAERRGDDEAPDPARAVESVFDYFAAQIFADIPEADRRALTMLAYLPRTTAGMAVELVESPRAALLLEALYRRHLFTDRRPGPAGGGYVYQFHALFRDFLRHAAQSVLGDTEGKRVASRAAQLAANAGQTEDAMALYQEAANWHEAIALVLKTAPALIAQGRWTPVVHWIESMPEALTRAHCWLRYWAGTAYIRIDAPTARTHLRAAANLGQAEADSLCEILSNAGLVFAQHIESVDLSHMDAPLERIGNLLAGGLAFGNPADEAYALSALVLGGARRQPGHPLLDSAAARLLPALADERLGPNARLIAAHALLIYAQWGMKRAFRESVITLARPFLASPELAPLTKSLFLAAKGHLHSLFGEPADAVRDFDAALDIARRENLVFPQYVALCCKSYVVDMALCPGTFAASSARTLDAARETRAALDPIAASTRTFNRDYYLGCRPWRAYMQGDWAETLRTGADAYRAAESHGLASTQLFCSLIMASASLEAGNLDDVPGWLERSMRWVRGTLLTPWEAPIRLVEARLAERRGDPTEQRRLLAIALSVVRHHDSPSVMGWAAHAVPAALALALREGIEADAAKRVISVLGILPPGDDTPGWPYALHVCVLGGFEVRTQGIRLDFPGKVPRRPLALLKALVCLGGRNGVAVEQLTDRLWPDIEADTARRTFKVTLHRLRELLGDPTLLQLDSGVLSLDRGRVWVDCWAFEAATHAPPGGDTAADRRVAELYRGPLLPGDASAPWTVSARENLRRRFNDWTLTRGLSCEQEGRWEDAVAFYRTGIERDNLVEAFYQGWMRCLAACGQRAEAAAVLERLRRTLALELHVLPSPETLAILR